MSWAELGRFCLALVAVGVLVVAVVWAELALISWLLP